MPGKQKKSAFASWRDAQFGPRPKAPTIAEVRAAEDRALTMRAALSAQQKWDAETNAALYAWNLKDEDKKVRKW